MQKGIRKSAMTGQTKVFHRFDGGGKDLRKRIDVILVRPEISQNVGAAARYLANMGINGSVKIVGSPSIINESSFRLAKHASDRLRKIQFFASLSEALKDKDRASNLVLAASARSGSAHRPHPIPVDVAVGRAIRKLATKTTTKIVFVFGPESDGLDNEEILLCDWVVTIPSSSEYRSLNLAQAILIFSYEANKCLGQKAKPQGCFM